LRALSVLSICLGAASAICVVVLLSCLARLDLYVQGGLLDLDTIVQGRLHKLIVLPVLWTSDVLGLELRAFFHLRAAFTMTCLLGGIALALQWRRRFECPVFGLLATGTGFAVYAIGYLRLELGGLSAATAASPWLAWMLTCLFYGAGLGILCGVAGLGSRAAPEYVISRVDQRRVPPAQPDDDTELARF
jgi:hypothetical protein